MTHKANAKKRTGFLARLRHDQRGNTFAIFAAAIFPMVGLVGGAVDMGRLYSVKTRLQAACDAGSLAARKVMGNGRWDVNNNSNLTDDATYTAGLQMFDLNFANGYIGSENRVRTFVEANGTVTGTASAKVPMALMQILGQGTRDVDVTCTSQLKIPHSDVMFVFDVTGSMAQTIPGDASGISKINGLKIATKCFYEALARENVDDVTPTQCNKTVDPIGDLSTLTQLRFGFVPFHEQINVGRLLPNGYFVQNQNLQSRRAETEAVQTWALGGASPITGYSSWSPSAIPTSPYSSTPQTDTWTDVTSNTTTLQGVKAFRQTGATNKSSCESSTYNNLTGSGDKLTALTEALGTPSGDNLQFTSENPPVHPASQQVLTYNKSRSDTVTQYRYIWQTRGSVTSCFLQANAVGSPLLVRSQTGGNATRPIIWTERRRITRWTYTNVLHNVAALKAGGGDNNSLAYSSSLLLPINERTVTFPLSGQSSSSYRIVSDASVAWTGCIEERKTIQNTDGDPSDEFSPIPDEAFDLDIDMVPDVNNDDTRWKYQLPDAVWGRHVGTNLTPVINDEWRLTTSSNDSSGGMSRNISPECPAAAARKMAVYRDPAGSTSFKAYVNALSPGGNTYHDIGLLWGARLMSPTGIFASENAVTSNGQEIQRHMIFMTDGETFGDAKNYTPYGIEGWDRRRTAPGTNPSFTTLVNNTDARTVALCKAIKNLGNNGVTLWVVYYGTTDAATTNRMRNCATSTAHFFPATNTPALIATFNQIADSISELKLTG